MCFGNNNNMNTTEEGNLVSHQVGQQADLNQPSLMDLEDDEECTKKTIQYQEMEEATIDEMELQEEEEEENGDNTVESDDGSDTDNEDSDDDIDDDDDDESQYDLGVIDDDITTDMIIAFFDEVDKIPLHERKHYMEAVTKVPGIVQDESNPIVFLRWADYNATNAARRLCDYWERRIEIFGPIKAFEPMTLKGACSDIVQAILQVPTLFRILPHDDNGRTVLLVDRTNVNLSDFDDQIVFVKIFWYVYHNFYNQSSSAQRDGVVAIIVNRGVSVFKRTTLRFLFNHCLPMKFHCGHLCYSSLLARIILPTIKYFLNLSGTRQNMLQTHTSLKAPTTLAELEKFGMQSHNLPKCVGGTYNDESNRQPWIDECEHIFNKQNRRQCKDKQKRIDFISSTSKSLSGKRSSSTRFCGDN